MTTHNRMADLCTDIEEAGDMIWFYGIVMCIFSIIVLVSAWGLA